MYLKVYREMSECELELQTGNSNISFSFVRLLTFQKEV